MFQWTNCLDHRGRRLNRIGDRTPGIVTADNGSLTIYMQREAPLDPARKANWLQTPDGSFYLDLRLYGPDDSLANGTWAPPPVRIEY